MKFSKIAFAAVASILGFSAQAHATCSIDQLMSEVRSYMGDNGYTYHSDKTGDPNATPIPNVHPGKDSYIFYVDYQGQTYEAIVTENTDQCSGGQTRFVH